jgi:putative nucleotidyltransferase with HDIG domain
MNYNEGLALLKKHMKNKNLIKHCIAVAVCMEGLAKRLNGDTKKWKLAGLLHDIDYEYTKDNFSEHGIKGTEILKEEGIDDIEIIEAIKRHAGHQKNMPQNKMDWALYSSDPLTGLIVAATLMHPTKKLENVDLTFLKKRFKEKRFAAGANREQIKQCEKLGLELDEFLTICLNSMKGASDELGL